MSSTDGIETTLSLEQTEAFDLVTQSNGVHRILYGGQAGGGKSFLICYWLIWMCLQYPGTRYYIARRVLKDIRESILLTFFDVAKMLEVQYRYFDKTVIKLENDCEIYLVECEDLPRDPNFDRLGSKEFTAGAIEEGVDVVKRAADILMTRTRYLHDKYGIERKQLITCNPSFCWLKEEIVDPYKAGTLKPSVRFIPATLASNPNSEFAQLYRDNLEELGQYEKARLLHGDWEARPKTGGEFWKQFDRDFFSDPQVEYDPDVALHISFDENVNPYLTCLVFQIVKFMEDGEIVSEIRQIDELCLADPQNTRPAICREFERRYYEHTSGLFIYGDATSQKSDTAKEKGENFFTDVRGYLQSFSPTLRVPKANPNVVSSANFINRIYEENKAGQNYLNLRIRISDKCKESIRDYAYTLEDSDGTMKKEKATNPLTKISFEKNGHCSDAKRYFLVKAFEEQYKQHQRKGKNPAYESGTDRERFHYR